MQIHKIISMKTQKAISMEFGFGKVFWVLNNEQPTVNTQFKNKTPIFFSFTFALSVIRFVSLC